MLSPSRRWPRTASLTVATARRLPRSMKSVPECPTMPPMTGQRTISAFATKRHGIAALIEKMSSQEM